MTNLFCTETAKTKIQVLRCDLFAPFVKYILFTMKMNLSLGVTDTWGQGWGGVGWREGLGLK